jgi:hypothetical protein
MNTLKTLYLELFEEFSKDPRTLIKDYSILLLKATSIPNPNQNLHRYFSYQGIHSQTVSYLDTRLLGDLIRATIKHYKSTRNIFDYFINNDLSPFSKKSFEEDLNTWPSITKNLIADFISRVFELSNSGLDINIAFFDRAFAELEQFLMKDTFSYKILINLHGPLGDINDIPLDRIAIKKASYEISKIFCYYYSDSDWTEFEMLENDYYIEIEREINKMNWFSQLNEENGIIEKIFNCLLFSNAGNIEMGKSLRVSSAWPLIKTEIMNISKIRNKYNERNLFRYEFNELTSINIKKNFALLKTVDYVKIDDKIKASIKRLKKAKSTIEIEDKIIELVLCIEYLVNTSNFEITLQLCLKIIKIYNDSNQDENIYKLLRDFFTLRGDVLHANKKVASSPKNVLIIQDVEKIIINVLLKYIILVQKYSLKDINSALEKSLYLNKPIEEILKNNSA